MLLGVSFPAFTPQTCEARLPKSHASIRSVLFDSGVLLFDSYRVGFWISGQDAEFWPAGGSCQVAFGRYPSPVCDPYIRLGP